jgi:uncharacterized membrane protein
MKPQERADRIRAFRLELEVLEREGALELSADQRSRLEAHLDRTITDLAAQYDVDTTASEQRLSLGLRIASALGGLALCAAVVLFIARYIGRWPTAAQVAVLGTGPIVLTLATEIAARRERTLYYAWLLSFVAFAAFVANLAMLGAIFNMAPTPNALAAWGVFGLALAYRLGTRLLLAASLTSLLGWLTTSANSWRGWWWWDFDRRPEEIVAFGIVIAVIPLAIRHARRPDFPPVFRLVGLLAFFLPMLALSSSGERSYLPWAPTAVEHFYQTLGIVLAAGVVWAGIRQEWTDAVNAGTAFFTIFLFLRLVDWWWDWMPKYLFFLLIGLAAVALVALFKRLRGRMRSDAK